MLLCGPQITLNNATQGREVYVTIVIGMQLQLLVWLSEKGLLYSTEGPKSLGNLMDSI